MFLLVCGRTTRFPPCPAAIVYPSGAAFATKSRPSMPLAPGRFSTSTGWPSRSVIFGPIRRAMMSVVLPGGNGTMILIGFEGQDCANAAEVNPRANAASTTTRSCLIPAFPRFRQSIILRAAIAAVIRAIVGVERRLPLPDLFARGQISRGRQHLLSRDVQMQRFCKPRRHQPQDRFFASIVEVIAAG